MQWVQASFSISTHYNGGCLLIITGDVVIEDMTYNHLWKYLPLQIGWLLMEVIKVSLTMSKPSHMRSFLLLHKKLAAIEPGFLYTVCELFCMQLIHTDYSSRSKWRLLLFYWCITLYFSKQAETLAILYLWQIEDLDISERPFFPLEISVKIYSVRKKQDGACCYRKILNDRCSL